MKALKVTLIILVLALASCARQQIEKVNLYPEVRSDRAEFYPEEKASFLREVLKKPPTPVRVPDSILRVLILPYTGEDGSLYGARYVYMVVRDGTWVIGGDVVNSLYDQSSEFKPLSPVQDSQEEKVSEEKSPTGGKAESQGPSGKVVSPLRQEQTSCTTCPVTGKK